MSSNSDFRSFIRELLSVNIGLDENYTDLLTDEKCMVEFSRAFTHKSIDPLHNYEYYEILGDATTNKIVVWYYHRRFPQLFNNPGTGNMGPVAIMARLKQTGISKRTYSRFSSDLGFWKHIRVAQEFEKDRTSILEDVFESFVGCLEYMVDLTVDQHSGYMVAYNFMEKIMEREKISIDRENLYDHKSKLNEDILAFRGALSIKYETNDISRGNPAFFDNKDNIHRRFTSRVIVTDKRDGKVYRASDENISYGSNKAEAEQRAAKTIRDREILKRIKKD
jgi:dsRNA-specific ribonuclease